jgi:hypothetical protein
MTETEKLDIRVAAEIIFWEEQYVGFASAPISEERIAINIKLLKDIQEERKEVVV